MSLELVFDSVLTAPPVAADGADVAVILQRQFGMSGAVQLLASERDANFRVDTAVGPFLFKITSAAEDPAITDLQTKALKHLERKVPSLPVPRVVAALDGCDQPREILNDQAHTVRLMSFMPGNSLSNATKTKLTRNALGNCLGLLNAGLSDFVHHASSHPLLWNAADPLRVRKAIRFVDDREKQVLAELALDQFEERAVAILAKLRRQVIHNDANPHNILVDDSGFGQISGIIDFGDIVKAPLVSELATALAYLDYPEGQPLGAMMDVVRSYHAAMPLLPTELDVVFDIVRARQVLVGVISAWRAARQPENSSYILRNSARAWKGLQDLQGVSRDEFRTMLFIACKDERA